MNSLELIRSSRLVAIIRLDDLSAAVPLSRALLQGGIVAQEYTLTNPRALEAISQIMAQVTAFTDGRATLGVGSVRTATQAESAIAAGAQFVVSPIHQPAVATCCRVHEIPFMSGAMTPTEIATAWEAGAAMVKVFPVRSLGPNYIKDVLAPMPEIQLMPTGGVSLNNMRDYFSAGACAVGVGGNLIDLPALQAENWEQISHTAQAYATHAQAGASA